MTKSQLKKDSLADGNHTRYFIDESEYKLRIIIDEKQHKTDKLDTDNSTSHVLLTCYEHRPLVEGQTKPFAYDFFLSCPKLFGDDKEQKISFRWVLKCCENKALTKNLL